MLDKANYQLKMLKSNSQQIKKQITDKMYHVLKAKKEDRERARAWISHAVILKSFLAVEKRFQVIREIFQAEKGRQIKARRL